MLSRWPLGRRIVTSLLICLGVAVLIATLANGLSTDYPIRLMQMTACIAAAVAVIAFVVSAITARLADYSEPADEEEFERLVQRTERLARENLAAEPDEAEFMALDPRNPEDFEQLVREALDNLPDLLLRSLDH